MKTQTLILCALAGAFSLCAQTQYSIDWFTIGGGGGTATGGIYTVSGTVGQPDAGKMSGGSYTVEGGYWSVVAAIQTPGAPLLSIIRTNGGVVVSWLLPATGWFLDETVTLFGSPVPWSQVPVQQYQTNSTDVHITAPAPTIGNRFYRLKKP